MEKTIYEKMGGTYTQQDDDLLPDVRLPEQENYEIGADSFSRNTIMSSITMSC